jgi:hypothetical protein
MRRFAARHPSPFRSCGLSTPFSETFSAFPVFSALCDIAGSPGRADAGSKKGMAILKKKE